MAEPLSLVGFGARRRWYDVALRATEYSQNTKRRMAAVLVSGGRVLSLATNGAKPGQHAEVRALRRYDHAILPACLPASTLYIAREDGGMSKPCLNCMTVIKAFGVVKLVYADWDGALQTEVLI